MIYDWYCPLCDSVVRTELKDLKHYKKITCPRCNMGYTVKPSKDKVNGLKIVKQSHIAPKNALYCDWCEYYRYFDSVCPVTELNITQDVGYCTLEANSVDYYYRKVCDKIEAYDRDEIAENIVKDAFMYSYMFRILCRDFNQANTAIDEITETFRYYNITYYFESHITETIPTELELYPLRITVTKESMKASILLEYGVFEIDPDTVYYYNFFSYLNTFKGELSPF